MFFIDFFVCILHCCYRVVILLRIDTWLIIHQPEKCGNNFQKETIPVTYSSFRDVAELFLSKMSFISDIMLTSTGALNVPIICDDLLFQELVSEFA